MRTRPIANEGTVFEMVHPSRGPATCELKVGKIFIHTFKTHTDSHLEIVIYTLLPKKKQKI